MDSLQRSKRSNNRQCTVEVRWGIFIQHLTYFLFFRAVINIPIQTLIISPWLLFRKRIISQLPFDNEKGSPESREKNERFFFHTKKSSPHDRQQYKAEVLKKPRCIFARTQALVMVKSRRSLNTIFTPIVLCASERHVKIISKACENVVADTWCFHMFFNVSSLKLTCKTSCKQACTSEPWQWFVTGKTLKF